MDILEISHIRKNFGSKAVLKDVSLNVPEHCIFGFIGRNGAGKTTAMKAVLGLVPVDSGEIRICGEKVRFGNSPANRFAGYLPDVPEFYGCMTAPEYLTLCGEITGMKKQEIRKRSQELLQLVGLSAEFHRIRGFSRGMKQRLGIAQALMNRPKLLICDEPTSALDPVGRREILDILLAAREETSVVFSTHILSDVERICDHISFLEQGKIALSGSAEEIRNLRKNAALELIPENMNAAKYFPEAAVQNGRLIFKNAAQEDTERILQTLIQHHIPILRIERQEADLEEVFMEVVGK